MALIKGGAGNDTNLRGSDKVDQIFGYEGADRLYGLGADDQLYGGAGNDELYGGDGADLLYGENGDDRLLGELGSDTLDGGEGGSCTSDDIDIAARRSLFETSRAALAPFSMADTLSAIATNEGLPANPVQLHDQLIDTYNEALAKAMETAEVSVMGSGDVELAGTAKCTVNKKGSGDVRCTG